MVAFLRFWGQPYEGSYSRGALGWWKGRFEYEAFSYPTSIFVCLGTRVYSSREAYTRSGAIMQRRGFCIAGFLLPSPEHSRFGGCSTHRLEVRTCASENQLQNAVDEYSCSGQDFTTRETYAC